MVAPPRLIIATRNKGKLREVCTLLEAVPLTLQSLNEFPDVPVPIEDGASFAENAGIKALQYARALDGFVLADDSGLVVDALCGAPGLFSARYAGQGATDAENNRKLIAELADVPPEQRTARFCCSGALANPSGVVATAFATWEGVIADVPRGDNGFGYDPYFWIPDQACTAAQLPPERKNEFSHRGQALRAIKPRILELVVG